MVAERVTMKQIPFLAFPSKEQDAVVRALRRAGVAARGVCVSRFELCAQAPFTTISTPAWCRTYPGGNEADWIVALEHELAGALPS